ncbi:GNAT family N-acetyltransferase [Croceicoccus ponticola]|nr:GNAT family N-acetyltransferase [Croceicoccus ponticola]
MMDVMLAAFDPKYGEAWNEQQLTSSMIVPGTRFAIIDSAGVVGPPSPSVRTAGFYLVRQVIDEEELLLIAVNPEYRRNGLASQLMRHLFASAAERGTRRVFLEMRADNEAGYFYENFGFETVGLRKSYYRGADGNMRDAKTLSVPIS